MTIIRTVVEEHDGKRLLVTYEIDPEVARRNYANQMAHVERFDQDTLESWQPLTKPESWEKGEKIK